MVRALLVDDEPINNGNLQALLARHCPTIEVIDTALNADEARTKIIELEPQVVFLDIEMPRKTGFDLLRSFESPAFDVVFVTAYDAYGIMAIKFSALDYLLKPIDVAELKAAVDRIAQSVAHKKRFSRLNNLLELLDDKQSAAHQKIALPTQKETYLVAVKDIVSCVSSNNYTTFFLSNGTEHLISKPLYEYEELLGPQGFIRCHQSYLVNKMHVNRILNEDSGYLIMDHTGQKIPVAKPRKAAVKALLKT